MNGLLKIFSRGNIRVLKALSAKDEMYLREIAEKTCLSPATVHIAIDYFRRLGFVKERGEKNRILFSLDLENATLLKVKSLINIHELSQLAAFNELFAHGMVGVYGSFASGKEKAGSDIDLWILPKKATDFIKLRTISKKIGEHFGMEAKLLVLSDKKIRSIKENDPEFYYHLKLTSVVFGGEIFD